MENLLSKKEKRHLSRNMAKNPKNFLHSTFMVMRFASMMKVLAPQKIILLLKLHLNGNR